jgi:O-antigen/teichoic acid export membrane protein
MLKKIFANSIMYTLAAQIPMVASLLMMPFISDNLNQNDYYVNGTVLAYVGMLAAFSSLGLIPLLQNSYFKDKTNFRSIWSQVIATLLLYRVFHAALVAFIIWYFFTDDIGSPNIYYVMALVAVPLMLFDITKSIGIRYFQFQHRHSVIYRSTAIAGIMSAVTTYVSIEVYELHYLGFFMSAFVGNFFQFVYFAHQLHFKEKVLPNFRIDFRFIGRNLRIYAPVIPHTYSAFLLDTSDRLVLDFNQERDLVSKDDIGLYNVAYSWTMHFNNFNSQVNTVVSPLYFEMFSREEPEAEKTIRSITFVWLGFTLIAGFLASIWCKEAFQLLYFSNETGLKDAYKFAPFLFMAMCYRPMYVASVDRAIFNEKTRALLKISTAAGILNLILNILLVPYYGVQAAVITTFASYMYMGMSGYFWPETRQYLKLKYYPLVVLAVISLTAVLAYSTIDLGLLMKALITVLVLGSGFFLYQKWGKEMIKIVNEIRVK